MSLSQDIEKLHDAHWDGEQQAARGKRVILVEGDDDRYVLEKFFTRRNSSWPVRVRIV